MSARPELAVFGGSFDPPHIGHVLLATYALSVAGVARVIAAPTYVHAFGKPLSEYAHRLRMCELAFAPLPAVEVTPIERELGGTSRTLRLVTELAARHPDAQLRLLVGADIPLETSRWQGFDAICRLAPLLVVGRGGYAASGPTLPEISSTELRALLARGDDCSAFLPAAVRAYIAEHGLYQATP